MYFPELDTNGTLSLLQLARTHHDAVCACGQNCGLEPTLQLKKLPEHVQAVKNPKFLTLYKELREKSEETPRLSDRDKAHLACDLHAEFARALSQHIALQLAKAPQNQRIAQPLLEVLQFLERSPKDFVRAYLQRAGIPVSEAISLLEQKTKLRVDGVLKSISNKKLSHTFISDCCADLRAAFGKSLIAPQIAEFDEEFVYNPKNQRSHLNQLENFIAGLTFDHIGKAYEKTAFVTPEGEPFPVDTELSRPLNWLNSMGAVEIHHASRQEFGFAAGRLAKSMCQDAAMICDLETLSAEDREVFMENAKQYTHDFLEQDFYSVGTFFPGPVEMKELHDAMGFDPNQMAEACLDTVKNRQEERQRMVI